MEGGTSHIEAPAHRRLGTALAIAIMVAFFVAILGYWSPGADGGDRNGYLLEGKLFATGKVSIRPVNEYVFLGTHWVQTDAGAFVLKYPPGLPAIYSVFYLMGSAARAAFWANLFSPLCAALALYGTFLILRNILDSFYAILGMLVLAVSPVNVVFAMMPNSHAASLCAVVWGMVFVFKYRTSGSMVPGILGGLILGFAATIRYTEATMLLPLLFVVSRSSSAKNRYLPVAAWAIPLIAVAIFNLCTLGHLSGYGVTHESTAFGFGYLLKNTPTMLLQLNMVALILIFPISVIGIIVMLLKQRDLGLFIAAWAIPTVLVYTAYYWAPRGYIVSYMRFILPAMPAMVIAAMWMLSKCFTGRFGAIASGVIVALAVLASTFSATVFAEDLKRHNGACVIAGDHVSQHVPPHSMVLSEQRLLPHLETIGDYDIYLFCGLTQRYLTEITKQQTDLPGMMQPARMRQMADLAKDHSDADLANIQQKLIEEAFAARLRVFLVLNETDIAYFRQQFLSGTSLHTKVIDLWVEPANLMTPIDSPVPASAAKPSLNSPQLYRTYEILEIKP